MSYDKAIAAKALIQTSNTLMITADTSVVFDGKILGKPANFTQAMEMIEQLQGERHEVLTAVCCMYLDQIDQFHSISHVWFRAMSQSEMKAYCQTDEPYDKAGGYAIQGIAAQFVERIEGSYSGIMGLPLFELSVTLKNMSNQVVEKRLVYDSPGGNP